MLNEALQYLQSGLQVLPANKDKSPFAKTWKEEQQNLMTESQLRERFAQVNGSLFGVGIVTGKVSGNLEVIDVDCKYDLTGTLFADLHKLIDDNLPELAPTFPIVTTRNGGYHIYYRCSEIAGSQKLARRPTTDEEKAAKPNEKVLVLIETRGQPGFIVAPPTPDYKLISGSFGTIPTITPEQRANLLTICRSFNEEPEAEPRTYQTKAGPQREGLSPFADYNQRGDVVGLLERHGWSYVFRQGEKIHLKRPGSSEAKTSANFHEGLRKFYVFSSSTQFDPERAYSPADVFVLLECSGDKKEAARRFLADGYGTPSPIRERVTKVNTNNVRVEASDANGEGENLAPDDVLTEGRVKQAAPTMEAAYIYYTNSSPASEVLDSLAMLEQNSPVKIYLVEVADLSDTSNPIETLRPSGFKAQDIINRYAEVFHANNGYVSPEREDAFIEEFISIRKGLTDPFEIDRFRNLWLYFSEHNDLSITLESIKAVEDKLTYNRQRDEQARAFEEFLQKAADLRAKEKDAELLKLLSTQSKAISTQNKADQFTVLTDRVKESDMTERIRKKSADLHTGYTIGGEDLLLPAGAITILAAPTSHGKTTLLLNLALRTAERIPDKFIYVLSYEEDADSVTLSAMNIYINSQLSANNRRSIRSYYRGEDYFTSGKTVEFEAGKKAFFDKLISTGRLNIQSAEYDADTLNEAIQYLLQNGNAGAIFIDYVQLLRKEKSTTTRQEELKQICLELKDVAKDTGLPIVLGAQFNRQVIDASRMHSTQIGEAGDIERAANVIIGFWNNNFEPLSKDADDDLKFLKGYQYDRDALFVKILKNRGGPVGAAGMLSFNGNTGVIDNMNDNRF